MKKKLSVHTIFVAIYLLAALLTTIPSEGASKACRLGYKSVCSFTPFGTLILLALAGLHLYLQLRAVNHQAA